MRVVAIFKDYRLAALPDVGAGHVESSVVTTMPCVRAAADVIGG